MIEPQAGGNAVNAIASAMLKAGRTALAPYGDQPEAGVIFSAAVSMMLDRAGGIDPRIPETVRQMLNRRADGQSKPLSP